jgi:hypothetical protein
MVPTTHPLARNELAARSLTLAGIATSWFGTWPQLEQGHIIIAATIALLAVSSTAASADCSVKPAIVALAAPLDELKPIERSASVRRSEEGEQTDRRMRFLELDEPQLPLLPERVEPLREPGST